MRQSRPVVPGSAHVLGDVIGMHDDAVGAVEDRPGQWEPLGLRLPEQGQQVVEHAQSEQPAGDAELTLHRVEIRAAVAPPDRDPGDQVVQDVLMQHDETATLTERIDDPAVSVRVVADVVERDVGRGRAFAGLSEHNVDALAERRQQE